MTNHPNRNKRAATRGPHPLPDDIAQTREEAELTQTDAAAMVEVSVRTWQDWEQARRKMPPGLWTYFCLQTAFPSEMGRLLLRWHSGNTFAE